jgi:hypothetical protein
MRLHGESARTGRRRAGACLGRRVVGRATWRVRAGSCAATQPVRAYRVDRPGPSLQGQHLRDGPDVRWVPVAWQRIRPVSLRWRSQHFVAPARGPAPPRAEHQQPACHARRHSMDRHLCRPRHAQRRDADPAQGRARIRGSAVRGSGGDGVGRHARRSSWAALRHPKRHAAVPGRWWRIRQSRLGPPSGQLGHPVGRCGVRTLARRAWSVDALCHAQRAQRLDQDRRRTAARRQPIRSVCYRTTTSIRTSCSSTAMGVSGSERCSEG